MGRSLLRALLHGVRGRRFDLAVSVYGPIAGTVVALSGARERRGYRREAPPFSFDRAFDGGRSNGGPHETDLAARLVEWQRESAPGAPSTEPTTCPRQRPWPGSPAR